MGKNRNDASQKNGECWRKVCCCCCGCCSSSKNNEEANNSADDADDEAHINAISSRQPETEPALSEGSKQTHHKGMKYDPVRANTRRSPRSQCKKCCISFTAFLFSHVGLCCLVAAYSIMGGFLFQFLEAESETKERAHVRDLRNDYLLQVSCYGVGYAWGMLKSLVLTSDSDEPWILLSPLVSRSIFP